MEYKSRALGVEGFYKTVLKIGEPSYSLRVDPTHRTVSVFIPQVNWQKDLTATVRLLSAILDTRLSPNPSVICQGFEEEVIAKWRSLVEKKSFADPQAMADAVFEHAQKHGAAPDFQAGKIRAKERAHKYISSVTAMPDANPELLEAVRAILEHRFAEICQEEEGIAKPPRVEKKSFANPQAMADAVLEHAQKYGAAPDFQAGKMQAKEKAYKYIRSVTAMPDAKPELLEAAVRAILEHNIAKPQ